MVQIRITGAKRPSAAARTWQSTSNPRGITSTLNPSSSHSPARERVMQMPRQRRPSLPVSAVALLFAALILAHAALRVRPWGGGRVAAAVGAVRPLRRDVETCEQWHGAQRRAGGELHYLLIGAQKSGTSTLSKFIRFHAHSARSANAPKEFHFLDVLARGNGSVPSFVVGRVNASVPQIRRMEERNGGFRLPNATGREYRLHPEKWLHGDATPRYMLSEEAARVAHLLHPHARVLVALRDPAARAVSHLNMAALYAGVPNDTRLPRFFDYTLREEMRAARKCGWDARAGTLRPRAGGRFSDAFGHFAMCVSNEKLRRLEALRDSDLVELGRKMDDWFVLRGLYGEMLPSWMHYFPHSRMRVVEFGDIVCGMTQLLRVLEKFLCLPPFSAEVYEKAKKLTCEQVLSKAERAGNNPQPSAAVITELRRFYAAHNTKLRAFMHHFFRGQTRLDWGY